MVLPRYLAMTRAEFTQCSRLPQHLGWMACHFSPYATGLTNLPPALPEGSMVILNDRIPMGHHDPEQILAQLQELNPESLLLDLQRPPDGQSLNLVRIISAALPCPVGIPVNYARDLEGPVFLSPIPADTPLEDYLAPWQGREIWLELSYSPVRYQITETGSRPLPLVHTPEKGMAAASLCCHYRLEIYNDRAEFDLWRTPEDLDQLLEKAAAYGVTKAVGLWQELGS